MSDDVPRTSGFTSERGAERFFAAYDATLQELLPPPVRPFDVPTAYGTVRAYSAGTPGPNPIVLVPGAGGNALGWYPYVGPLSQTRPVIVIDPIGEPGRSTQTVPVTEGSQIAAWLDEFLAGVDAASAHLVGTSFGGWSVTELLRAGSERVAGATLVEPAGFEAISGRFYRWIIVGGLASLLPRRARHWMAGKVGNGTLR